MKSYYARKLNHTNILLGIHILFKLVIILTLFIVLYTTIWLKEKYLTLIKTSIYIQIFIFLASSFIMLSINNPKSFDICSSFQNFFYLIVSILEKSIIIIEIIVLIQNLKNFIKVFHECAYYRTYEEIIDKEYKRTCFYYITDYNNELPYKYICYYNSENEYYNKFCDGIFCKKNNNKNEINSYIKCYGNVDRTSIHFSGDNEFYLKDIELINRYKSSNLYACFRKEKIVKNENLFNKDCPDSNPINKMIIFIYCDIILHFLIDFLFIYEFILLQKIKQIYGNLVLLQSRAPINYLNDEDLSNMNHSNTNKQTCNTDNKELMEYPQTLNTFNMNRENSITIIIEPGEGNSNCKDNKDNNSDMENQIKLEEDNIEINYNQNTDLETNENKGIINRKAKIFKIKNQKEHKKKIIKINYGENDNNNNMNKKNPGQRMVILDIKKDEEYGINRMNFFIKKKARKKRNIIKEKIGKDIYKDDIDKKNNNNINEELHNISTKININNKNTNEDMNTISTNININNNEKKKIKKINISSNKKLNNYISDNESSNEKNKNTKISINKNDSNNNLIKKKLSSIEEFNNDIKNNSNIELEQNNNKVMVEFKKDLQENK